MFLTPGASRLGLPNPCSSSTISSVHDPESPTQRWNSITVTSCGSPSRWRCWTHGHLQKGPPTMGTPWPSSSLVSSGGTGGTEGPQKPFLFHTLSMGKRWRRRWSKALAQTLDAAHGPGFSYKIQLGLCPLVEPMEQGGIQTPKWDLSGITERAGGRGRARCGVIPLPLLAPPGDNDGINELISFIPRENLAHREKEWR